MKINGYDINENNILGRGAFGTVYLAENNGIPVAIKVIQADFFKENKERVLREVDVLKKLKHENIVSIQDSGSFHDKGFEYFYIVMNYVHGDPLEKYIGNLSEDKTIQLLKSLLDTLSYIHSQGVIHRDLKPSNVIIDNRGIPVILDFGLSKLIDYSSITRTGELMGTWYYMSPEQIQDSKHINEVSDFYAIGAILYEIMTGEKPFTASSLPALIDKIKNTNTSLPSLLNPDISTTLEKVILKLLEKDPYKRFQTKDDILKQFDASEESNTNTINIQYPFFVRLLHTEKAIIIEAIEKGLVENINFPANFLSRYHPTVDILTKSKIRFISDPSTNRLAYPAFTKVAGLKALKYANSDGMTPIQDTDLNSISDIQKFVSKVLNYQVVNGVNELVAPFFYFRSENDIWLETSFNIVRTSVDIRNTEYSRMPIWGGICFSIRDLYKEKYKKTILNYMIKSGVDGYLIYPDSINPKTSPSELHHYIDFAKALQESSGKPVITCRVNGFGLILLGLGLCGFSSGISALDSFDESILASEDDGFSMGTRYYIPEIMAMVSFDKSIPTKITDLYSSSIGNNLKCSCEYCKTLYNDPPFISEHDIKMHFLTRRKQEINRILEIEDQNKRKEYILSLVDKAIEYSNVLKKERIKVISDFSYLKVWKELLESN